MNSPVLRFRVVPMIAATAWLLNIASASADSYAQWKARVFTTAEQGTPAVSDETAIPAGDGITNLEKFAFDLDPHQNGRAGLPIVSTVFDYDDNDNHTGPFLAISYRSPLAYTAENISCVPEVSSDLVTWMRGLDVIAPANTDASWSGDNVATTSFRSVSPMSQNSAIFLRLRVIEGHQLPAEWEEKYFGTTGISPDLDPDGDGVTTWQEYLNGTDPTDYYNAHLPELFLAGGGNQRGTAGSLLPQPISVKVNYYGNENAPLTFTASGGALLAPDGGGTYTPSATVAVRSTGQINVNGSQTYVAQVYVYLPSTASTVSTITASAATAGQTVSVSTTAVATDPNTQPPAGVDVAFNTDSYVRETLNKRCLPGEGEEARFLWVGGTKLVAGTEPAAG